SGTPRRSIASPASTPECSSVKARGFPGCCAPGRRLASPAMDEPSVIEFLVEHYLPGATRRDLREASSRLADAAGKLAAAGEPIRYLGASVVPVDGSGVA